MIAGNDPVAIDSYGLEQLKKLEPRLKDKKSRDIAYLRLAEEYGLGRSVYTVKYI